MVLDVRTEIRIDGIWTDITVDVRQLDPITINWGVADESSRAQPSTLNLTLNNANGKYSPRNPLSTLFGKIGRNTPIRVRLGIGQKALSLPGLRSSFAVTPDTPSLDIGGDIDIRVDVDPATWRPGAGHNLAAKYVVLNDQRSWLLSLDSGGTLTFYWTTLGTFASRLSATSTVAIPNDGIRRAVRVTLDVNNGASGRDIKFYTSDSVDGAWTQLGATVTQAGVTSIFEGTAPVDVGSERDLASDPYQGDIFAFQLRSSIAGTVVANPDFTTREAGDVTFTDSAGRSWTIEGAAGITDTSVRFSGEISSWPSRWDLSGKDVWVPVEAAGIRRRLDQGSKPFRSTMFRDLSARPEVVGYWPLEDGSDAGVFASGLAGHPAMSMNGDEIEPASFEGFAPASDPLPVFKTPSSGTTGAEANIPTYIGHADQRVICLVAVPPEGVVASRRLFTMRTSGSVAAWTMFAEVAGGISLNAEDADGTIILNTGASAVSVTGIPQMFSLLLEQVGADLKYQVARFQPGANFASIAHSGTLVGQTYGRFTRVQVGPSAFTADGFAFGHYAIINKDINAIWDVVGNSLVAWSGEAAVDRMVRLSAEEGVPLLVTSNGEGSHTLGPQRALSFLELIDSAAEVDRGILEDDRDSLRLIYRPGVSLLNQSTALTLNYGAGDVAPELTPVEDDQLVRNDITVKRPDGASARVVLESGTLSVAAPPGGVGRYDTSDDLNVKDDGQLLDQANWKLHVGTVDEARYPNIPVDLTATPSLTGAAVAVRSGDRIKVIDPPPWLPPEAIDQLARGGQESMTPFRHQIIYNTSPASPWTVGVVADVILGRADTLNTTMNAAFISGTNTSMAVTTNKGPLWVTAVAEFPFDIKVSGVVLTVTAIGAPVGAVQTFTVSAAPVNGVIKTIPAGSDVRLANPATVSF